MELFPMPQKQEKNCHSRAHLNSSFHTTHVYLYIKTCASGTECVYQSRVYALLDRNTARLVEEEEGEREKSDHSINCDACHFI